MLRALFKLRGKLTKTQGLIIGASGFIVLIGIWSLVTVIGKVPKSLLPAPWEVLAAFRSLHFEDALVRNMLYSIKLNFLGYMEATVIAIPIGFTMGLFPVVRAAFKKYIDALRFLPLAAITGLFICWFGIDDNMKIQFLAVSIIVYLIPVIIQHIDDVEAVYLQTAHTLGARTWQKIWYVFCPAVLSKTIDSLRVLTAISWTYITIAEALNMGSGGIGALAVQSGRRSEIDKVFAVLVLIILIGFIQDKLFELLDRKLFPHKYC